MNLKSRRGIGGDKNDQLDCHQENVLDTKLFFSLFFFHGRMKEEDNRSRGLVQMAIREEDEVIGEEEGDDKRGSSGARRCRDRSIW